MDGVLTDDNDAFLYGANTVYCELSANEKVLHKNYPKTCIVTSLMLLKLMFIFVLQELSMSVYSMSTVQQLIGLTSTTNTLLCLKRSPL